MTVEELKTALKRYGFDDTDPLLIWLNAAYHEIEDAFKRWPWLEVEETVSVSAGESLFELTVPAKRFIKVRDVTNESSSGGRGYDLEFMDRRTLMRVFPNLEVQGDPEYFTIVGENQIQLYPVPKSPREVLITSIKALEDLAEDSEIPQVPVSKHYTIVRGAAYVALQAENEEERAASAQAQFESDLAKMIDSAMERQIGEAEYVEDVAEYGE